MKPFSLAFLLTFALGATLARGATHMVSPGQSIQTAINAASSGDEIVLQTGSYDEDLLINGKGLTFRAFGLPWIVKSINVSNSTTACKFQDFQLLGDINSTGTDIGIRNANIAGSITVNQAGLKLTKSTVDQDVSVNHPTNQSGADTQAIILQSTIKEKLTCKTKRSWICYNTIRHSTIEGITKITGNTFDGRSLASVGIDLNGTHTQADIRNNRIYDYKTTSNSGTITYVCIGIGVRGNAKADIVNNLIYECRDNAGEATENKVGMGIYVESTAGTKIFGNIIYSCYVPSGTGNYPGNRLVWAPNQGVLLHNNCLWASNSHNVFDIGGGVVKKDCIDADPKLNSDKTLQTTSPAINAGPPDPQYNDRDGTRNDIGMFGGHNFIPDGRTTNKPIVIGLDVAPIAVPAGGTVTIESTGATVK